MINELWHSNWSFSDLSCTIVTSNDQRPRAKYLCQSILETRSNKIDKAKNQSRSQKLLSNFYGNCKFLSMAIFVQFVFVSMISPIFTHFFVVFFCCSSSTECHWKSFKIGCCRWLFGHMIHYRKMSSWVVLNWNWAS